MTKAEKFIASLARKQITDIKESNKNIEIKLNQEYLNNYYTATVYYSIDGKFGKCWFLPELGESGLFIGNDSAVIIHFYNPHMDQWQEKLLINIAKITNEDKKQIIKDSYENQQLSNIKISEWGRTVLGWNCENDNEFEFTAMLVKKEWGSFGF